MNVDIRYFTRSKKGNTKKLAVAVSKAIGVEAKDVSVPLSKKTDVLILINAMYAATVDKQIKDFIEDNGIFIGEIVNMNTSATGRSTLSAVKRAAEKAGVKVSDKEFHCRGSWVFLNKGYPTEDDLNSAGEFAKTLLN